jgi:hypothetical protein
MSSHRNRCILVHTGIYIAAILLVAVATSAPTPSPSRAAVDQAQSVDRSHKSDRVTRSKAFTRAGSAIAVELSGKTDLVIRDREGNILFAVDNAARATTVAKQSGRDATSSSRVSPPAEGDLPEGCEGAFSPYAEPSKARVVGRCVSSILSGVRAS